MRNAPIVESISGELSFLMGSGSPGAALWVAGHTEPFPDAEALMSALRVHRGDDAWMEQYSHGRVANSLGAVYICTGQLPNAFRALDEAELKFAEMLDEGSPHPEDLTLLGLAVTEYNSSVLMGLADNYEAAAEDRLVAFETLSEISEGGRDRDYEFLRDALLRLPE